MKNFINSCILISGNFKESIVKNEYVKKYKIVISS